MDDDTFGRNGRDAGKGWQHSASAINYVRDRGGVWWMLVLKLIYCFILHVTTSETEKNYFGRCRNSKIISATLNMLENVHELQ